MQATITAGTKVRSTIGTGTVIGVGYAKGYVMVAWDRHFGTAPHTSQAPASLLTVA